MVRHHNSEQLWQMLTAKLRCATAQSCRAVGATVEQNYSKKCLREDWIGTGSRFHFTAHLIDDQMVRSKHDPPELSSLFHLGYHSNSKQYHVLLQQGLMATISNRELGNGLGSPNEPNELIEPIHNRMPVILRPEDEEPWLDACRTPFSKAKSLLKPYPAELMDAHDVSPIVNSVKYDGPEWIQPVSDDDIPSAMQLSLV